ncbi:MAG: pectin acetylesterase-family hydrolase [Pseudomonadales bacterium]
MHNSDKNNSIKQLRIGLSKGLVRPLSLGVIILIPLTTLLVECSGGDGSSNSNPPTIAQIETEPFSAVFQQGITKYLGIYSPMLSVSDGDSITHSFGTGDGSACFNGSEYAVSTRDMGSEDLLIVLGGGGFCWSDICWCVRVASPEIPKLGILDPNLLTNPVRTWNTVYLPYCDGSLFSGDIDLDTNDDGIIDRYHRGLKNLSAGLDVAVNTFAAPRRILIAGSSAGGYATAFAMPLVRNLYPNTPIYVLNDSGTGIFPPGTISKMLSEWNAMKFIPESCPDCIDESGHLTNYHAWQLAEDENMFLGMMSYNRDGVIADFFFHIGGDVFQQQLTIEMSELEKRYPARMRSFIAEGRSHTFLAGDLKVTVGDVTVADWVSAMLGESTDWISRTD